jgi:glycosyltransferase involved in cell wall biosynthesis
MTTTVTGKTKLMLVWTGGVNPIYHGFFSHLTQFFDLTVIAPRRWKHGSIDFRSEDLPVEVVAESSPFTLRIASFSNLGGLLGKAQYLIPSWPLLLRRHGPEIIYWMDEPDRLTTWLHLFWAKAQRRNRLLTCAYMLQNLEKPAYYKWHHQLAWRLNAFSLDSMIVATRTSAIAAKAHGIKQPLSVIPLYADAKLFSPPTPSAKAEARRALRLAPSDYVLAYAGSLHPAKGIALLSRALPKHPQLRLIVASGDSWNESLGPAPHAHLGPLQGKDLLRLYHAADAVILPSEPRPSWQEQIGRILLEGGLAGCLVMGSDSGAIPEIVGDADLVFNAGHVFDLNRLLATLPLSDSVTRQIRQRERYLQKYTDAAVASATAAFLISQAQPSQPAPMAMPSSPAPALLP